MVFSLGSSLVFYIVARQNILQMSAFSVLEL
jgi:hypothetical protein